MQDVLESFLRRTLRTRWAPVAGKPEKPFRGAVTVGAQTKEEGPGTPAEASSRQRPRRVPGSHT
ncbi:hypothetical protein MTO96_032646, partial [Rhipicephalus appendiculatus]